MDMSAYVETDTDIARYHRLLRHMRYVRDNLESILEIKKAFDGDDKHYARQLWAELDDETQIGLWVAITYGGIFTTKERSALKGTE